MPQDPYAQIAQPAGGLPPSMHAASDPYAAIAENSANKEEPGFLDRADSAITSALAINPRNLSRSARTNAIEVPKTFGRELYSGAKAIAGTPSAIYHSFSDPETEQEKTEYGKLPDDPDVFDKIGLGVGRMTAIPIKHAIEDYRSGKVTPEAALENAPEAIGQGAGTVVGGKLTELAAPKVAGAARGVARATVPPVVRGLAKGANTVLQKAPGTVGAAVGGAIGHSTGVPLAGETGAIIGGAMGRELLPKLTIPGENFRVEHPVFPGAPLPEHPGTFPGAPLPEHPGTFPGAPFPETPSPEIMQARGIGRGGAAPEEPAAALGNIRRPKAPEPGSPAGAARSIAPKSGEAPKRPIGDLLNESLGGELPEGHTSALSRGRPSAALKSYKYDPATQEFEAATSEGIYVTGEVTPEQFQKFENAKSKGTAWKELRDNGTPLAKIVNGKRVPRQPPMGLRSAVPDELSETLARPDFIEKSVAKTKAARKIARPN